jgi:hypothetical protein
MIRPDTLPRPLLHAVAAQIGSSLPRLYALAPALAAARTFELAETVSLWCIDPRARPGNGAPDRMFRRVGYWHQLAFDGKPAAYAQTSWRSDRNVPPRIEVLGVSPIVAKLDAALDWIDRQSIPDAEIRLVDSPALGLHACWLAGPDHRFVIIHAGDPALLERTPLEQLHGLDAFARTVATGLAGRIRAVARAAPAGAAAPAQA